mmetsp:Transcript_58734/g.182457  ORF Transcript_58734/g.182457 Transcript_58734/m.182457 type:complete len:384 (+) Transcript_58734:138-1289(+)
MGVGGWITGLVLAAVSAGGGFYAWQRAAEAARYERAFQDFVREHGRSYGSAEEWAARREVFSANLAFIEAENRKGHPYVLGVNAFADQTPEEFGSHHLGMNGPAPSKPWGGLPRLGTHRFSGKAPPASIDWSAKGAVTPPKNQAQCGSCWSFSTTGALEGAWEIATGKLVPLSEQQLVDCSKDGNMGCKGGSMDLAFQYLESHASCTEDSYPYTAKQGSCRESNCTVGIPRGGVVGFKDVPAKDMDALTEAVAQQPVSVAIEADQRVFQLYTGGVLTQACGAKLDHGVLLVGYGTEGGVDYWKVKNSWGPGWGEHGYIRMKRGVPKDGECGINDGPTYPVVKSVAAAPLAERAPKPAEQAPAAAGVAVQASVGSWQFGMAVVV